MRNTKTESPDFVNSDGVKWWHEKSLSHYAFSKGFTDTNVWIIERLDGYKTFVFTDNKIILAEDNTLEGIGIKIDLLAYSIIVKKGET